MPDQRPSPVVQSTHELRWPKFVPFIVDFEGDYNILQEPTSQENAVATFQS